MSEPTILAARGAEIARLIPALASLRLRVFRDWPYLYEGSAEYEARYLARLAAAPGALMVGAWAGGELVGASTALPLCHEHEEFITPLREAGIDPDRCYYGGESVLLPAFRGRGLYRVFFAERENEARAQGFERLVFCGVIRPDDHPARPADFQPLDPIWRHFGYAPLPGVIGQFSWQDIGETAETPKPMQFWSKLL